MTEILSLIDQPSRDRFVNELDRNFCVSAGAGAGKTTAISHRVAAFALRAVQDGSAGGSRSGEDEIGRLVVVTYTKAAARELQARVRRQVLEELQGSAAARQRALAGLRRAFFGTIHSFCQKLIVENGQILGIPETLQVLGDETDPDAAMPEAEFWERFRESDALQDVVPDPALSPRVLRHLTYGEVLKIARTLPGGRASEVLGRKADTRSPTLNFSESLAVVPKRSKATAPNQARLREWKTEFDAGASFLPLPKFKTGDGAFKTAFEAEIAPYRDWLTGAATRLAAKIALCYQKYRREHGFLTYDDMIEWCGELVRDEPVVRRLRERESIVILDEAQDTNLEMFRVLTELTRPRGAGVGDWPEKPDAEPPGPGALCMVGDDQQAIYSGRAPIADYLRYVKAFDDGSHGAEKLVFSVTMRCSRNVIGEVNRLFAGNDKARYEGGVRFRDLVPHEGTIAGGVQVVPVDAGAEGEKCGLKGDEALAREVEAVARFLRARGKAGLGVNSWSEVAVLAPRHDWLTRAREVLSANDLPCRQATSRGMRGDLPEFAWPTAVLYLLGHPWDRFELIGILREVFGHSDAELAVAHCAAPGGLGLDAREGVPDGIADALGTLRELRDLACEGERGESMPGPPEILKAVISRLSLVARIEAVGGDASQLDAFRRGALDARAEGDSFVGWTEKLARDLASTAPGKSMDADRIELLTCQKAKGLEWPVVIPVGLARGIGVASPDYPRQVRGPDGSARICLNGDEISADEKAAEKLRREEENLRLLYVTLTRAKRTLLLPDAVELFKKVKANKRARSFFDLCGWEASGVDATGEGPPPDAPDGDAAKAAMSTIPVPEPDGETIQRAVAAARNIPRRVLPHALVRDDEALLKRLESLEASAEEIAARPPGGTGYGTWFHETLERLPFGNGREAQRAFLDGVIQSEAAGTPWEDRAKQEFDRFLDSEFLGSIDLAGSRFLPEVAFSFAAVDDEWIEGTIDLVIVKEDGGMIVVDWKTNRPAPGEAGEDFTERLREHYRPQLEAYARFLREGMNRRVDGVWLYSTVLGEGIEV